MREAVFVKLRGKEWKEIEDYLTTPGEKDPDTLADHFITLTDDLAFARTQYPESHATQYLNTVASKAHHLIYVNKKEKKSRFVTFWKEELPGVIFESRLPLLWSLIIFSVSVLIGAVSAAHDDTFIRLILGDGYVDMTLENIERGDPMGVYKDMGQLPMFFMITFNNIRVSLIAFAAGIIFSFGTGFLLFRNGVMLGAFQYFFYQKGLFITSFLTIWIHGTIEIASIIIAGGAGLVMGNSFLFPGTLPRGESLKIGAKKGLKIVIGLIPMFIIAGFLESYVTRLTEFHWSIKLGIILSSLLFLIYYFVILPSKLMNAHTNAYRKK